MGREIHFVLAVDIDTGEIRIDDETYMARFSREEGYWHTDKQEWFPEDQTLYSKALEILNSKATLEKE